MRIALVDDTKEDINLLAGYLERYQEEKKRKIEVHTFLSSIEFLEQYQNNFDIIFLDIEMPGTNGIEVAKEIRQKDSTVAILFVTNMIQYAICGYEVNAIDFMVKPVEYFNFTVKLEKAMGSVKRYESQSVLIGAGDELRRMKVSDIYYIEKDTNHLVYHTITGILRERGTMVELKERLAGMPFGECTAGSMVNFEHIELIHKDCIQVGEDTIPLSRRMKKTFIQEYLQYMGGNV